MAGSQVEPQIAEQKYTKAASQSDLMRIMTGDGAAPSAAILHRDTVTSGVQWGWGVA